jgi:hypothetical protein
MEHETLCQIGLTRPSTLPPFLSLFALAILLTKKENTTTTREMKRRTTGLLMMDSPKWISEYDVHSSGKTRISFLFFFFLFYSNFNNWNPFYGVLPLDKLEIKFLFFLIIFRFCWCGLLFLLCGDKQEQLSTSSSDWPAKKKSTGRQQAT